MEIVTNEHQRGAKPNRIDNGRTDGAGKPLMFEGKNIHSSPIDGKLLCSYSEKVCMQRRLNGFAFCIRHILEDKGAPFKQCQFFAKYNKSRCINPVPILEERDYCNSHRQVLGIIPKKVKKKSEHSEKLQANHEVNIKAEKSSPQKNHVDRKSSNPAKDHEQHKNYSHPTNCISSLGSESLSSRANRKYSAKKVLPPLQWSPPNDVWKRMVKRQKADNSEQREVTIEPDVLKFKHLCRRNDREAGDLFRTYMFDRVEDEASDLEEVSFLSDASSPSFCYSIKDFRRKLKHQKAQLKQSIKAKMEDKSMTFSVLQSLVNAAKANAVQTANILKSNEGHKRFREKKCRKTNMRCAALLIPDTRCSKSALPYSRHCLKHISNDEDQVLYGTCTARFAAGPHCSVPVVDLINERPLCSEHALKKQLSSTGKESMLPSKQRLKRPDKTDKIRGKVPPTRKNLKAKLQKKFAIPNKPMKKSNSHIGISMMDDDKSLVEKRNRLKMTFGAPKNMKWMLAEQSNDAERSEGGIVMPRPAYSQSAGGLSPSSSDLAFDINAESLSSPSLMSEEEDRYPLMNIGRRHHDSFTFDDDEDLLQSNAFAINRMPGSRDSRGITSPPIAQFSAEPLTNNLSLGDLCSPAKIPLEKQLFESSSVLKQESNVADFNSESGIRRGPFSSSPVMGHIRSNGILSPQSTMSEDRYITSDANSTRSVSISANLSSFSSTSTTWPTKFTLPTRTDQLAVTNVGFIRVDPSGHNNIYSPPFTSPTLPSRSKADFFKFESNSKQLENDNSVTGRILPSYTAAVRGLERKFDAEPPLQKVNPDIFLSTIYTVTESSNS